MREVKFRGIRKDNGEWAYGYYYEWHGKLSKNKESAIHVIVHDDIGLKVRDEQPHVIPETVGQYTGLKDKNGKEIYEGDILGGINGSINGSGWKVKPYEVKYVLNNGFDICMYCWDKNGKSIMDSSHYCEVIGSIHKDPGLLKGGK